MQQLENALKAVPQVSLAALPTPFMRMENLEKKLNHAGIFIKRDDLTGLGPGGNKLRSLEFLLGEAMAQSADTVIAAGPPQSNLCTLTAAACAKLALRCVLVHNGDKPPHEEGNILLNRLLGAQSHYLGNVSAQERTACTEQLSQELAVNHRPYVVKNGATTGRGALGYVKAIPELQRQTASLGLAGLTIFAPGGNGGVAAGLICGNALCGFPFQIVIISVENDCQTLTQDIRRTVAEAADCLRLPLPADPERACIIDDSYRGEGWGVNTPQSSRMITDFAGTEGILAENIYNSKVLVGMQDYLQTGRAAGPVCFLHTGGFGSLFAQY